ncbi:MAG: PAS domain-containing protein [Kiritimatiellae bacterium]|nr:PAS domain-containing protein [Kiritimatiellia bacterium]
MNLTVDVILGTIIIDLGLGVLVFLTNSRRLANQLFLLLAVHMSLWAACVLRAVEALAPGEAAFWIRSAFFVTALFPGSFAALHLAIRYPGETVPLVLWRSRIFWILNLLVGLSCYTPFFLRGVQMPPPGETSLVADAVYGPGFLLFVFYFAGACAAAGRRFFQDLAQSQGIKRAEFQFVLLGFIMAFVIGATASLFLPLFSGTSYSSQFGPVATVALNLCIAYGIATHRIMDVTQVLRKTTAYGLLAASLVILYGAVWWAAHNLLVLIGVTSNTLPNLLATLAVALSMAPAHGHMQRFANQLFINMAEVDIGDTVRKTSRILHSISTMPALLNRFAGMVTEAFGTERVAILLLEQDSYVQRYPEEPGRFPSLSLTGDDPLVRRFESAQEPVVTDLLERRRPTPERLELARKLSGLKASIAIGIRSRERLDGIMLLGPRLSGRIYGNIEQSALQILCDQLAVALENARLYTETQNSKIYHEILLDNLVSGVVAVDAQGLVTVFNREAQRITRMEAKDVLDRSFEQLPDPLAIVLQDTLQTGRNLRYLEMAIHHDDEDLPIRVGTSIFRGHTGRVMGALAVFSDQTQIRKLEMQVRRTDRLASVGTLSAGMAHEIKNPLVSIKTFAQLLPERYQDPEFRDNFAQLFDLEVKRIDSIVNQLLNFARPAKPHLSPSHLHAVLDNSLRLVEQQLQQKGIRLERSYTAPRDVIHADADLLDQAFVNFFLNAVEAMPGNGSLSVTTELVDDDWNSPVTWNRRATEQHIRVTIRDSGCGIPPEDIHSIFDPFYTTKSNGTGLGLSVAHGIIQEHGGAIDVESEPRQGTSFHISFPLIDKEVPA